MDPNVFTPLPAQANASNEGNCLTFWEGITLVGIVLFGVGTIVRGLSDPLSALHFYAAVFRSIGMVMLLTWCIATVIRKFREVRKYANARLLKNK
jgi:hypothetical protein